MWVWVAGYSLFWNGYCQFVFFLNNPFPPCLLFFLPLILSLEWSSFFFLIFFCLMCKAWHVCLALEVQTPTNGENHAVLSAFQPKRTSFFSVHHPHLTFISSSEFSASPISPFRTYLPVFFPCPPSHSYDSALHLSHLPPEQQIQSVPPPTHRCPFQNSILQWIIIFPNIFLGKQRLDAFPLCEWNKYHILNRK